MCGWGEVRNRQGVAMASDSSMIPECEEPGAATEKGPELLKMVGSVTTDRRAEGDREEQGSCSATGVEDFLSDSLDSEKGWEGGRSAGWGGLDREARFFFF